MLACIAKEDEEFPHKMKKTKKDVNRNENEVVAKEGRDMSLGQRKGKSELYKTKQLITLK